MGNGNENRGESPKHGFRKGFERGKQVSGSKRFESFKVSNSAECSRAPGNRFYYNRVDSLSHSSKENGISRRGPRVDSGSSRIDSLVPDFEFNVQNCLRVDSSSSESILKSLNPLVRRKNVTVMT
ncbi:hypothetical protein PIB30_056398 [Stylosanthes scabra]|uniref:Uncharacterized protein n=1 Tax=Stylosanthes scabra TaxID=79078 RepID=A0ABU6WL25_9FABA|nr:hypothetical protein [Stylosanthes scabra]